MGEANDWGVVTLTQPNGTPIYVIRGRSAALSTLLDLFNVARAGEAAAIEPLRRQIIAMRADAPYDGLSRRAARKAGVVEADRVIACIRDARANGETA